MAFIVHYDQEHNCVISSFAGDLVPATFQEYMTAVMHVASDHHCTRFLSDLRGAKINFLAAQIYDLLGTSGEAGGDSAQKKAIVVSDSLQRYVFFGPVALEQGFTVRLFSDPDEAMRWLERDREQPRPTWGCLLAVTI